MNPGQDDAAVGGRSEEGNGLVTGHLCRCDACAEESVLLGEAVAAFSGEHEPPAHLRGLTLGGAFARRAPSGGLSAHPYAAQVAALDALLRDLADTEWTVPVLPEHGWNVQDVVAHLAATDGFVADQLPEGREPGDDIDARTSTVVAFERTRPPPRTLAAWRAQSHALRALSEARRAPRSVQVRLRTRLEAAMVARAFETWIHGVDIATALGRAMPAPRAEHLHTMADLGVRSLPAALALTYGEPPEGSARVVLAGDGGGDWTIRLGTDSPEPVVTLALDVLEFCFVAADRLPPHEATTTIEGDIPLGRRLLASASAFAGP